MDLFKVGFVSCFTYAKRKKYSSKNRLISVNKFNSIIVTKYKTFHLQKATLNTSGQKWEKKSLLVKIQLLKKIVKRRYREISVFATVFFFRKLLYVGKGKIDHVLFSEILTYMSRSTIKPTIWPLRKVSTTMLVSSWDGTYMSQIWK